MARLVWALCLLLATMALAACGTPAPTVAPTAAPTPMPGVTPSPTPEPPPFDVEGHFSGRTIRMIVPFGAGGGVDVQARFLATALREFLPGRPNIQVQNLTPVIAGTNFVWNSDPDGLTILYTVRSNLAEQMDPSADFRASEFQIVSSAQEARTGWVIRGNLPYDDIRDAVGQAGTDAPIITAAGAAPDVGAVDNIISMSPMATAYVLDLPFEFRAIAYTGTDQLEFMVERGDINSTIVGGSWQIWPETRPGWLADEFVKPFANIGFYGLYLPANAEHPGWENIPHAQDLMSPEQAETYRLLLDPFNMPQRSLKLPPGTPPEVVKAWRDAWQAAINDENFHERFSNLMGTPIYRATGEEIQQIFQDADQLFRANQDRRDAIIQEMFDRYVR